MPCGFLHGVLVKTKGHLIEAITGKAYYFGHLSFETAW